MQQSCIEKDIWIIYNIYSQQTERKIHTSDINNTLKKKENQYHHLTEKDRATIQALIEQKDENGKWLFNNTYIANYLGVHRFTIYREIKNRKSYRFMVKSGRTNEKQNSMIRYFIPKKLW